MTTSHAACSRRGWIFAACLVFLIAGLEVCGRPALGDLPNAGFGQPVIDQHLASARQALRLEEVERAEHHLRLALVETHSQLGWLAFRGDDFETAAGHFAAAVEAAPNATGLATVARGASLALGGHADQALAELRQRVRGRPDDPRARRVLAHVLVAEGQDDEAAAVMTELRRIATEASEADLPAGQTSGRSPLSTVHILMTRDADIATAWLVKDSDASDLEPQRDRLTHLADDLEDQITALVARAEETSQTSADAGLIERLRRDAERGSLERHQALILAEAERHDGRLPASNRQLRSLVERFASAHADVGLARNAAQLGNLKMAIDHARRALRAAPTSEIILRLYAGLGLDAGLASAVAPSVETLARMRPENGLYVYWVGRVWMDLGDMGEASEALLRAVALDPERLEARRDVGLALVHESRYEDARPHLEYVIDASSGEPAAEPEAQAALAEIEQRFGQTEAAEQRVRAVLEHLPDHARANFVMGRLHSRVENFDQARLHLEKALAAGAGQDLLRVHHHLSVVCARLEDRECALEHTSLYRRGLAETSSDTQALTANSADGGMTLMRKVEPAPDAAPDTDGSEH